MKALFCKRPLINILFPFKVGENYTFEYDTVSEKPCLRYSVGLKIYKTGESDRFGNCFERFGSYEYLKLICWIIIK